MGATEVAAALEQLAELTSGPTLQRAGSLARGLRLLRGLAPDDKRELAARVAERAAPALVPRIRAQTGMDLTAQQLEAVLDLVRRLDRDDLGAIVEDVRRGEVLDVAERVADAAAAATGAPEDGLDDPAALRQAVARLREEAAESAVALAAARSEAERHANALAAAERSRDAAETQRRELLRELEDTKAALHATEVRAREAERRAERLRGDVDRLGEELRQRADATRRAVDDRVALAAGAGPDGGAGPTGAPIPMGATTGLGRWATGPAHVAARARVAATSFDGLLDALRSAGTGRERLALLDAGAAALRDASPDGRRRAVEAVPDGWARRRAIARLATRSVCDGAEAVALAASLGRRGERRLLVGELVRRGLVSPDAAAGAVDERAAARPGGRPR